MDSEKEDVGMNNFESITETTVTTKKQISDGGKGFNVPEIEFQEYKVNTSVCTNVIAIHVCVHLYPCP